jgi:hypothetical protein
VIFFFKDNALPPGDNRRRFRVFRFTCDIVMPEPKTNLTAGRHGFRIFFPWYKGRE